MAMPNEAEERSIAVAFNPRSWLSCFIKSWPFRLCHDFGILPAESWFSASMETPLETRIDYRKAAPQGYQAFSAVYAYVRRPRHNSQTRSLPISPARSR